MRRSLLVPLLVLLCIPTFDAPRPAAPPNEVRSHEPSSHASAPVGSGSSAKAFALDPEPGWDSRVAADVGRLEYEATVTRQGLQAPNRAQNLRTRFGAGGIALEPRSAADELPTWQVSWRTTRWGRDRQFTAASADAEPRAEGARVSYAHDGLDEWYENKPEGLEQGFTIHARPPGSGSVVVAGRFDGAAEAKLGSERSVVDLVDPHGALVLRYGELHVWDARHRALPSHLELDGTEVAIVIDDEGASYPVTIDPLFTTPSWTAEPNQSGAVFGCAVSSAGDVNGDGYSDVIVGAYAYDNGSNNEGRAFVYHGSPNGLVLTPAWTAESNQADALFGWSVSTAGDVNGDGYSDVIVGAPFFDDGESNEGRVFVYLGSASGLALTPSTTVESNQANAQFGAAVSRAGDVDHDGFDDVIIGAPMYDNGQADEGRAFVHRGSAGGLAALPAWSAESDQAGAQFGYSVACAGDVNSDGYADVIVGAWVFTNGQANEGKAFVYHGSASGVSTTSNWTAEGNQAGAHFGVSVAGAGDVDGDGYGDLLVGADGYTNGQSGEGAAVLYRGSATGARTTATITLESNVASVSFGHSVASAGDVNGDGYSDIAIGAHNYSDGQSAEGIVFVFEGHSKGIAIPSVLILESNQANSNFGISVASAGDVNGDGCSDVIVGAWLFDNGQTDEGRAFVYHGQGIGVGRDPGWEVNQLASDLAPAGDVNGDGYDDVLVGDKFSGNGTGLVLLYYGDPVRRVAASGWSAVADQPIAQFGNALAGVGDVNGDGYSDVVVGAPNYSGGQTLEGRVFVYHGSPSGPSLTPATLLEIDEPSADFGHNVEAAGDVNGDGYADVVVGAATHSNGQLYEGGAYVFHGGPTGLSSTPAWTVESDTAGAYFGMSVACAGDVNGDGYSDVLVGSAILGSGRGRVSIYFGSASGLSTTASVTLFGPTTSSNIGWKVGFAGDVNGDGFSDVFVLAAQGRVFVYHGSPTGPSVANWNSVFDPLDGSAEVKVSSAGDVNADGYSDLVLSQSDYDANEGVTKIVLGSPVGLAGPPLIRQRLSGGGEGFASAGAGDLDGDGYSDVIVASSFARLGVYTGSDSTGLDRKPRQRRANDSAPIGILGRSDSPTSFRLSALGRTSAGRGEVRMQFEVKPFGQPFNGTGLVTSPVFDTGVPVEGIGSAVPISQLVSGLAPDTPYHWRLRLLTDSPHSPVSVWMSPAIKGSAEAHVRTAAIVADVEGPAITASEARLEASAPNPFVHSTRLDFTLPSGGHVALAVYDVTGRRVRILARGAYEPGRHSVAWDGRSDTGERLRAGVYLARLESGGRSMTRKIMLER